MKCQNCGNELKPNNKFCDNCGIPVVQPQPIQPKKKGLKAWHIILIVLGGFFALIGLFFCFILWIGFTFGTTENESTIYTTSSMIETSEPDITIYDLDIDNTLKNIKYRTPSEFETKGTSGLIFNHKSPEGDNILVSYTYLGENITFYTESQSNELLDAVIEGVQKGTDSFELYSKKYTEIASCYGIDFSYELEGIYAHTCTFLWKDGSYQFSYSSTEPISDEDEYLFEEIINSIMLQN